VGRENGPRGDGGRFELGQHLGDADDDFGVSRATLEWKNAEMSKLPSALALSAVLLLGSCGDDEQTPPAADAGTALDCGGSEETAVEVTHEADVTGAATPEEALSQFLESRFADGLPDEGYRGDNQVAEGYAFVYERSGRPLVRVYLVQNEGWLVDGYTACTEITGTD
jgi:hypothetical protein